MALLLASARDLVGGANRAASPTFARINADDLGKQVSGSTLGIVGMGSIGIEVARRAAGFRMKILYHNRSRRSVEDEAALGGARFCGELTELLAESDFVMVVVPATPATAGLMGAPQFAAMKSDAHLINIARGVVVDQDALVAALTAGEIGAAALDVTVPEPLPRDHPLVATAGTPLDGRVLITPHQGSATAETRLMMMKMAFDNLEAGVNPAKPRLPWTVAEAESLFAKGCSIGSNHWSGRDPKQ
jgi:lactate dehydrogenase-like 2-hydroxyacid dehydrogenase